MSKTFLDDLSKVDNSGVPIDEMSRGVVILDNDLEHLAPELSKRNVRVIIPPPGTKDPEIIKSHYLPKRMIITNNSKDFENEAAEYEYGVIATENIRSKNASDLAKIISKAIIDFALWSKGHGFVLRLMQDGKHQLDVKKG